MFGPDGQDYCCVILFSLLMSYQVYCEVIDVTDETVKRRKTSKYT